MNRAEIKEEAKKIIKGNKWNIWKAILVVGLISGVISGIVGSMIDFKSTLGSVVSFILELALVPLTIGLTKYVLDLVRGNSFDLGDIFKQYNNFLPIIIATALMGIIVGIGSILLVIPGIIAALGLSQIEYLLADGETDGINALKTSWNMMKGYKWDIFVFSLSFIGWILLCCVTLGIALIWVVPYMTVSFTLYYEKLKDNQK